MYTKVTFFQLHELQCKYCEEDKICHGPSCWVWSGAGYLSFAHTELCSLCPPALSVLQIDNNQERSICPSSLGCSMYLMIKMTQQQDPEGKSRLVFHCRAGVLSSASDGSMSQGQSLSAGSAAGCVCGPTGTYGSSVSLQHITLQCRALCLTLLVHAVMFSTHSSNAQENWKPANGKLAPLPTWGDEEEEGNTVQF